MTDRSTFDPAALPTLAQLQETRVKRWHQSGEALLTFENVRSWLNAAGLVLFVPRPQIAAPAPSMVEAVRGATTPEPTLDEGAEARTLLGRLVAEGVAVPLNLLGTQGGAVGESPDYVASAAVFPYIFTLRGDKAWKQPPSTSGPNKVSQLAAHTYEILVKQGARSAADLTHELGSGVTEAAVVRALGELWTHLRVFPSPQQDGRATLWELTSTRFTKQIKAGANAGQPSALSALISLYLGQVAVATEDEVEVFLSPLASRSRVRDVIHALTAARQLDTVAIEGRTMVHLSGDAPSFVPAPLAQEEGEAQDEESVGAAPAEGDEAAESAEPADGASAERIKKFVPKPRKIGTGYLAKGAPAKAAGKSFSKAPAKGAGRGDRPAFGRTARTDRPAFGRPERADRGAGFAGKPERERRPFQKARPAADGGAESRDTKPRFDRPWQEGRPNRAPGGDRPERRTFAAKDASARPRRPREDGGAGATQGWKPAFGGAKRPLREGSREPGGRPEGRAERGGFESRGARPSKFGPSSGGAKRPFRRPEGAQAEGERPARPFRRFDAPRPGGRPAFERRPDAGGSGERPRRQFAPRAEAGGAGERPRRQFSPRPEGGGAGQRPPRQFGPRAEGTGSGERPRRQFGQRPEGGGTGRPSRPEGRGGGFGADRRPSKFAAKRTGPPREGGFSARPRRTGPPGDRPFGNKGASAKRPAKRTFKRKEDESA